MGLLSGFLGFLLGLLVAFLLYRYIVKKASEKVEYWPEDKIKTWEEYQNDRGESEVGSGTAEGESGGTGAGSSEGGSDHQVERTPEGDGGQREVQDEPSEPTSDDEDNSGRESEGDDEPDTSTSEDNAPIPPKWQREERDYQN